MLGGIFSIGLDGFRIARLEVLAAWWLHFDKWCDWVRAATVTTKWRLPIDIAAGAVHCGGDGGSSWCWRCAKLEGVVRGKLDLSDAIVES